MTPDEMRLVLTEALGVDERLDAGDLSVDMWTRFANDERTQWTPQEMRWAIGEHYLNEPQTRIMPAHIRVLVRTRRETQHDQRELEARRDTSQADTVGPGREEARRVIAEIAGRVANRKAMPGEKGRRRELEPEKVWEPPRPGVSVWSTVGCPYCGAKRGEACVIHLHKGTRTRSTPHPSRIEALQEAQEMVGHEVTPAPLPVLPPELRKYVRDPDQKPTDGGDDTEPAGSP